jgi:teichuronic acid biosynthesis glycosyltransferase TuaH
LHLDTAINYIIGKTYLKSFNNANSLRLSRKSNMLLKNKSLIFLGNARFDGEIKSTSLFIARNLAKDNKVFFLDYPFTIKDYFKTDFESETSKERKRNFSLFSNGVIDTDISNLKIVVSPPVLPINFLSEGFIFRLLLSINERIIARRLRKILSKNNIEEVVYINAFNFHYPNISKYLKPRLTVYQCVDPMIVPYDMKHGIVSEKKLVCESDVVICTSKALYREKSTQNPSTYFVPNGTDLGGKDFSQTQPYALHPKLSDIPRPIVGYLGTIERRINYPLIQKVILANSNLSFVFAGPISEGFVPDELYKTPNVSFLGPIAHKDVEQVISNFDVAIIPFKKDEVSNTIFPIKLFEYLSAGIPVVASDFNEDLKDYTEQSVEYCGDWETFSTAIKAALKNNGDEAKRIRKDLARKNTWEIRAEQISKILNSHLSKKV